MEHVTAALPGVVASFREGFARLGAAIGAAEHAFGRWALDPAEGDALIRAAMVGNPSPYALSAGEPLLAAYEPPAFEPMTVVAADGSSIDPDRFAAVPCFVINVGWVVLPYGVDGDASLAARATLGPEAGSVPPFDGRGWGVTLRRDVTELEMAVHLAAGAAAHGPVVMLLDGTLLPWDLDSRLVAPAIRNEMEQRTRDALERLQLIGTDLSAGAYVSTSRAGDLMTSLAALGGSAPGVLPPSDGMLFGRLLRNGQRSAVFATGSSLADRVETRFAPAHEVRFFYLRIGDDVARVEVPHWASSPAHLGRLHAALVDQCRRCAGYPRALQEAHEQAVISGSDRLMFTRLLESESSRQDLPLAANGKQISKRVRAL